MLLFSGLTIIASLDEQTKFLFCSFFSPIITSNQWSKISILCLIKVALNSSTRKHTHGQRHFTKFPPCPPPAALNQSSLGPNGIISIYFLLLLNPDHNWGRRLDVRLWIGLVVVTVFQLLDQRIITGIGHFEPGNVDKDWFCYFSRYN